MRLALTMLVLACFLMQQFSCCPDCCAACDEDQHAAEPACPDHDHHDEDESPAPDHDSHHHLCVATHLFYLTDGDCLPDLPDFDVWQIRAPASDDAMQRLTADPTAAAAARALASPVAGRVRAALQVWLI